MEDSPSKTRDWTSMSVSRATYRRVKSLKRGGESFDELLGRLADETDRERGEP